MKTHACIHEITSLWISRNPTIHENWIPQNLIISQFLQYLLMIFLLYHSNFLIALSSWTIPSKAITCKQHACPFDTIHVFHMVFGILQVFVFSSYHKGKINSFFFKNWLILFCFINASLFLKWGKNFFYSNKILFIYYISFFFEQKNWKIISFYFLIFIITCIRMFNSHIT